jgi:hypothetical protein
VGNVQKPFELRAISSIIGYGLAQNYPNPFRQETTIAYSLPEKQAVKVIVYNQVGSIVKVLVDEVRPAGSHEISLSTGTLASGLYTYKMIAGNFVKSLKMVIVK